MVGLGHACELVKNNLMEYHRHMETMRDRLEAGIGERFEHIRINGHPTKRLPNTLSASFRGMEANIILDEMQGVFASAGAACHSDHVEVSSVLEAMQVPMEYAMGTLRFSVGRYTTEQEIDRALEGITRAVGNCAKLKA
jgi:cysteine desulfurase